MAEMGDQHQQIVNFTVGGVNYGVPVDQVREVRDMQSVTPVPGAPSYVKGVTNLRGQIITVIDLRKRLELADNGKGGEKIIVIEMDNLAVGVVVDSVTEVSTIAGKNIEKEATTTLDSRYVLGIGKEGDRLVVILDLRKVITGIEDKLPGQESSSVKKVAVTKS